MDTSVTRTLALAAGFLALAGCNDITVNENLPLRVNLAVTPTTASVNQTVEFAFEAQGRNLQGVILAYGDGAADSVQALGAQRAGARLEHVYQSAADFRAVATVYELTGQTRADTVVVPVSGPSGG